MNTESKQNVKIPTNEAFKSAFEIYPNLQAQMEAQLKAFSEMQRDYFRDCADSLNKRESFNLRIKSGVNRAKKHKHKQRLNYEMRQMQRARLRIASKLLKMNNSLI